MQLVTGLAIMINQAVLACRVFLAVALLYTLILICRYYNQRRFTRTIGFHLKQLTIFLRSDLSFVSLLIVSYLLLMPL